MNIRLSHNTMDPNSGPPISVPFEFVSYDDECLGGFYMSSSTFQTPCDIPYGSSDMSLMGNFFMPDCTIQSIEDPELRTVPTFPEQTIYNGTITDADSVFSWSTFSNFTESPQPSPQEHSSSSAWQKEKGGLLNYGVPTEDGSWRCTYMGCNSKTTFQRGCDLRKHSKRHVRNFFCRHSSCPKSLSGGFSYKKDRARHEARHNPIITCEWDGCQRVFSRMDNMRDHLRRKHHEQTHS